MESFERIAVIFAAFVNDADQTFGFRVFINDDLINLAEFERRFVIFIVDANYKFMFFHNQSKNGSLIFISFLPMPCASRPMNFRKPNSAAWKFDIRHAFQLSPTTASVHSIQTRQITNAFIDGDNFNLRDFVDECKINHFKLGNAQIFIRNAVAVKPQKFEL